MEILGRSKGAETRCFKKGAVLVEMAQPCGRISRLKGGPLMRTVEHLAVQGSACSKLERLRETLERFSKKYRVNDDLTLNHTQNEAAWHKGSLGRIVGGVDSENSFMSDELRLMVEQLSSEKATALSLRTLYLFGKNLSTDPRRRLASAQFLHRELPVRFCHRAHELMNLPNGLSEQTGFRLVSMLYATYAYELITTPKPTNAIEEYEYTCLLAQLMMHNRSMPELFSLGLDGFRQLSSSGYTDSSFGNGDGLQHAEGNLNRFFLGRVGLWFLMEQHVSSIVPEPGFSGIIQTDACPVMLAREAISDVEHVCRHQLGCFPKMSVLGDSSYSFTYVPAHIRYMLGENESLCFNIYGCFVLYNIVSTIH